ncbi:MAG: RNB domain-containing ribonuclease [Candidatus Cloacimonetes bacterium]|nr:RNB domain-containing ribonuclease [Candidatus Cloacimonadota bacterium]
MNALQTGSIVAFYHKQDLCLGIITACDTAFYLAETGTGESIRLQPKRILIQTSSPHQTSVDALNRFHAAVTACRIDIRPIHKILLQEQDFIPFEHIFPLSGITEDAERFALLFRIKAHPELFLYKHDLIRSRTAAETEEYLIQREEETKTLRFRQQITAFITEVFSGSTSILEPDSRQQLITELQQALRESRNEGILALIRAVDSPLSFEERILRLRLALEDISAQTDAVLALSGLPVCFSPALQQAQITRAAPVPQIDLTGRETFTIDDETTRDIDDAFSWAQTNRGYELGIHISCLSTLIEPADALWQEAIKRASALYLPTEEIPMLPPRLAWQEVSLIAGKRRNCLSLLVDLDPELRITGKRIVTAEISVDRRHTYIETDHHDDRQPFRQLMRLTSMLYQQRQPSGTDIPTLVYNTVVDNGLIHLKAFDPESPSRRMVAELMVLYNQTLADHARSHHIPVIYRNIREMEITTAEKRPFITSSVYHATQASHHPGINSTAYAHFTSPIRRAIDLINQAQIVADLYNLPAPYQSSALDDLIPYLENRLTLIKQTAYDSQRYWFLRYLRHQHLHHPISLQVIKYKRGICLAELLPWRKKFAIHTENAPPQTRDNQIILTHVDPEKRLVNGFFI